MVAINEILVPAGEREALRGRCERRVKNRGWFTRDPIGVAGGINLYGYISGRAAATGDPSGQKWVRLKSVRYCEACYAGSWNPIPVHAFVFVSGHEYGFFPALPPSGVTNEIRDLVYEKGIIRVDDDYSNLPDGDKGLKAGALYRQCYDVEVDDCIVDPTKAVKFMDEDVQTDLKHPPHYSYLLNDCVDWAHGVIHDGVVKAERSRYKDDARPGLLRYAPERKK